MVAILRITDGTDHVDMLGPAAYRLRAWRPSKAPIKAGGVWQSSPLADGRRLVAYRWDNLMDTFTMDSFGGTQDDLVRITQDAERLLVKALDYWTAAWQNEPVWVETKADKETNARYAVVKAYDFANYSGPYEQPFASCPPSFNELLLVLEHGPWLANVPGEAVAVEISGTRDYYDYTAMGTVAPEPTLGTDDGYVTRITGAINLAGNTMIVGNVGGNLHDAGIRFRDVTIPNAAFIGQAYLLYQQTVVDTNVVIFLVARGELNATPATFGTFMDFVTRTRTDAWMPITHQESFVGGPVSRDLADFRQIVQEIINLPGWASGNHLVLFIQDNVSDASAHREIDAVEVAAPQLHIQYVTNPAANTWTFGRTATTQNEVYVSNKENLTNLTHVFKYDSLDGYTQLLGTGPPYDLLPNTMQVGDAVYFGIASDAAHTAEEYGPFFSLVLDIGSPITRNDIEIRWEYSLGPGAYGTLECTDHTNLYLGTMRDRAFTAGGVNSVHWDDLVNWAFDNWPGPGVQGLYIRARVIATGAAIAPPQQQNRDPYTITWGGVDVAHGQVGGDVPALLRIKYYNQADYRFHHEMIEMFLNHLIVSARSSSRGSGFTPYINLVDRTGNEGVIMAPNEDARIVYPADARALAGQWLQLLLGSEDSIDILVQMDEARADQYIGSFRCFLRMYDRPTDGRSATFQMAILGWTLEAGGSRGVVFWESEILDAITVDLAWGLLDFGKVTIPPLGTEYGSLVIRLRVTNTDDTLFYLRLSDIILMPVDEWAGEFSTVGNVSALSHGQYLDIDSVSYPKQMVTATLRYSETDAAVIPWSVITNGEAALQANADQKLWFLAFYEDSDGIYWADPHIAGSIQVSVNERYLGMRGAR